MDRNADKTEAFQKAISHYRGKAMSHYTELRATIPIRASDAALVRPIIEWLLTDRDVPETLPDHPLFKHSRVDRVLHNSCVEWFEFPSPEEGSSEYYRGKQTFLVDAPDGGFVIEVCAGINHERGVIGLFHDWISAFIDQPVGHAYGWFKSEGNWYESPMYVGSALEVVYEPYSGRLMAASYDDPTKPPRILLEPDHYGFG